MYMTVKGNVSEFEWDKGNISKNYIKHGITPKEAEEVFISEDAWVKPDMAHSQKETRYIILGTSESGTKLFIVFTLRKTKIRIVSARKMHKKEVQKYEKAQKNSSL